MWLSDEELKKLTVKPHWWSGFPGGFCMFCGSGSMMELCCAECPFICAKCGEHRPNPICDPVNGESHGPLAECLKHKETSCPVQGEQRVIMARKWLLPEWV